MKKIKSNEVKKLAIDPGQKSHDSVTNKSSKSILNATGDPVSNPVLVRKGLIKDTLYLLQSSVEDKLAGTNFLTKLDLVGNHLHEMKAYVSSLKGAIDSILAEYPSETDNPDSDRSLGEMSNICNIVTEGAVRVEDYLNAVKDFGSDLDNIKSEIHNHIVTLHQEI